MEIIQRSEWEAHGQREAPDGKHMGKERMKFPFGDQTHADKDWLCCIFSAVDFDNDSKQDQLLCKLEWFVSAGMARGRNQRETYWKNQSLNQSWKQSRTRTPVASSTFFTQNGSTFPKNRHFLVLFVVTIPSTKQHFHIDSSNRIENSPQWRCSSHRLDLLVLSSCVVLAPTLIWSGRHRCSDRFSIHKCPVPELVHHLPSLPTFPSIHHGISCDGAWISWLAS